MPERTQTLNVSLSPKNNFYFSESSKFRNEFINIQPAEEHIPQKQTLNFSESTEQYFGVPKPSLSKHYFLVYSGGATYPWFRCLRFRITINQRHRIMFRSKNHTSTGELLFRKIVLWFKYHIPTIRNIWHMGHKLYYTSIQFLYKYK